MISPSIFGLMMFPAVVVCLMLGYPVAFTLGGVALLFGFAGYLLGFFDPSLLGGIPPRIYGVMFNQIFVAVPLFVFMGLILERSRISEDLLETLGLLFGRKAGGLGISVVIVGALLAASTGVVGATVVTMGLISLPAMLRAGYDPKLASGIICASGTLGQIIPPSTILILLADILQGAYAQAQMRKGNFAPESISVVDLFAGALIPGLLLAGLYALWVVVQAVRNPASCPPLVITDKRFDNLGQRVVKALVPPLALIVVVLGSILTGMATSTESAALGAVGALILAASRRLLTRDVLLSAMRSTMALSSMCFMIVIGASLFALIFRGLQGEALVETFLHALPGGPLGAMAFVMILIFLLGFILDFVEIMFMVLPIVAPVLLMMDISPVWLGVMIAINLQTSFLTPPVGFALFYFRSIAPPSLKTTEIYRGIIPFVALQLVGLALVWAFPGLATWLPQALFGGP
jgi:tripartite ATP-independent transporter DctM subunit